MLIEWQSELCTTFAGIVLPSSAASHCPNKAATFPLTIRESVPPPAFKRDRLQTDVDGENSVDVQKKKRRLRFDLVTSRLSQPYATPATHIISRKVLKLGPVTRPRPPISTSLRRAAILNAIRMRRTATHRPGFKESHVMISLNGQSESMHTEVDLINRGIRTPFGQDPHGHQSQKYLPPPPSPLRPADYDAFDEEEDPLDEEEDEEDDDETSEDSDEADGVYSDFSRLDTADSDVEDYDSLSPFSGGEEEDNPFTFQPPMIDLMEGKS
ncbi:MAG: hypothetical protein Q9220_003525 [cf. Caloplaca sp. 1 TL-2023]